MHGTFGARKLDIEEQRCTLESLAREKLREYGNDTTLAAADLSTLLMGNEKLRLSVLTAVCERVADELVREQQRRDRSSAIARANSAVALVTEKYGQPVDGRTRRTIAVADIGEATAFACLNIPLFKGILIKDATKAHVIKYADFNGKQGRTMLLHERYCRSIAALLPKNDSIVRDHVDPDTALRLWKEAKNA